MKTLLTKDWNLMRILRLVMGIAGVTYAVISHDIFPGLAGVLLIGLSLFNAGCCCAGSCTIPKQPGPK